MPPAVPGRSVLVEACVTSVEEAVTVADTGAHRLELCVALEVGGLTPPVELVRRVKDAVTVPVFAMARPRAGSFVYRDAEVETILRDVAVLLAAGADGVVVGFLRDDGSVDLDATRATVAEAKRAAPDAPVTFHRAFDLVADPVASLEALAGVGVARLLTAGGPGSAREHADTLAALVTAASGSVEVLVGGGVRADHVRHLMAYTGAREVHARAQAIPALCRALADR